MTTSGIPSNNVQPPAPPAVAALQPKDAEIKLFKTNVDVLWFETVLKAAWYEKPFALISYLWNRSDAVQKDAKFGQTVELLNSKLTTLVEAVARKTLSSGEAAGAGIAGLQFSSEGAQNDSLERQLAVKKAEKEFYEVFQTRCQQLEIDPNHRDFGALVLAVQNKLQKASKNEELLKKFNISSEHMRLKIDTLCKDVSVRVFDHVLTSAIPEKIEHLTPDSFKKAVTLLQKYVPNNSVESIETQVRKVILEKFGKALENSAKELLTTKHAEKVAAVKTELVKAHTEKEASILAELNALRGTNGTNGTVNAAHTKKAQAKMELDDVTRAFRTKYEELLHTTIANDANIEDFVNLTHLPTDMATVKAQFIAAKQKHSVAEQEYNKLDAQLKKNARFAGDEKVTLNTRRLALCGPVGNDGAIHQAYEATIPAQAALTAATNAFRTAYDLAVGVTEAARLADVPVSTLVEQPLVTSLNQVKADYLAAKAHFETLDKAKKALDKELADIVNKLAIVMPMEDSKIIDGELIKAGNAKADAAALVEATAQVNKHGNFHNELFIPVKQGEEATRSAALRAIIG